MRPPIPSGTIFVKDPIDQWNKETTIGLSELATRLGSPSTFDRRGTVWWYDTFNSSNFSWVKSSTANGANATLSDEYPYTGEGCAKLTHGNLADSYMEMYKLIGSVSTSRIGIEAIIHFQSSVNLAAVLAIRIITGTRNISAAVRVQQAGLGGLSYGNTNGNSFHDDWDFTQFDDTYSITSPASYPIKFVVDVEKEKYTRCMFGGDEIDMSSYEPYSVDYTNIRRIQPYIGVVANSGVTSNITAYFDNIIITIEEPE